MNGNLCFRIEGIELYLEQVLVDYMDIPIFFLCKGESNHYLVLCTNIDELNYIIVRLSMNDLYELLHGEGSMRNAILKQNEYWNVISGEEISLDKVGKLSISELDVRLLPKEDVYFEIVSMKLENYVKKFDTEYFV
ncbi:hypothetical protein [uncultured Gemella sp.]|uniref:hypothetical protein n=1 Tax=uncultured Gemella sp. TaxID=254352 RepID=UPI0028D4EA29|nr:hypothetical protein [uncultured Gemella sp.]